MVVVETIIKTLIQKRTRGYLIDSTYHALLTPDNLSQDQWTFMVLLKEPKVLAKTTLGLINVADDPLTLRPELNSTTLGRAQGIYGCADQNVLGAFVYLNHHFTYAKFKGRSTLSLLGRNEGLYSIREMSIVGGTGVFQLAGGIAAAKLHFINTTTLDVILEYNVVVLQEKFYVVRRLTAKLANLGQIKFLQLNAL